MKQDGDAKQTANAIGEKLRHARKVHKLTLKEVANRLGCSESMVSKVERGRVSPTLQMAAKLAEVLGTSVAALFTEKPSLPIVIYKEGERPTLGLGSKRVDTGETRLERLIPFAEGRLLNANLHVVPPGGGSSGTLAHTGEEVGFVIEGFIELAVNGEQFLLGAGSSFFFASSLPHRYKNIGTTTARIIWANSPPY